MASVPPLVPAAAGAGRHGALAQPIGGVRGSALGPLIVVMRPFIFVAVILSLTALCGFDGMSRSSSTASTALAMRPSTRK